jgi:hypothetical protein
MTGSDVPETRTGLLVYATSRSQSPAFWIHSGVPPVHLSSPMNTFAAFGVGLGNLGQHSRVRIATPEWIAALNRDSPLCISSQ